MSRHRKPRRCRSALPDKAKGTGGKGRDRDPERLGEPVTEQELMFKLNLLDPGTPITDQTPQNNANVILEYLRDRGYYNAEVTYLRRLCKIRMALA